MMRLKGKDFIRLHDFCLDLISLLLPAVPAAIQTVEAVEGLPTELPCDITPPNPEEKLLLVLWYRQDEGEPIYR